MKNKNGFTLVELLAVIAILAILVIIALPNILSMFNSAKKNSFETEAKEIYKSAEQAFILKGEREFSNVDSLNLPKLEFTGRKNLKYYVSVDTNGKITTIKVTDGTYQYENTSITSIDNISSNAIEEVSTASRIVEISNSANYTVNFYNYDGTLLESKSIAEGTTATPTSIPTKDSGNYTYPFSKWVTAKNGTVEAVLTNISSNMDVYASFSTTLLKLFYINGERCSFIDKIGVSTNSTWGYYVDFCGMPEAYGGSSVGSCPKNNRITQNNTYLYLNNTSTYLLNKYTDYLKATNAIVAGEQYGDSNYISNYNEANCFVSGTKVYTKDGYKNIEDIQVNDMVYSYNEKTKKVELQRVVKLLRNTKNKLYELTINGEKIRVSETHKFYTNNKEWVEVRNLTLNDQILTVSNNYLKVNKIEVLDNLSDTNVYNFTVENNHTYYVGKNGLLVHNTKGPA